jgi:hypothetical protein
MKGTDLRSHAGHLLYAELPEEYRYRDPAPADGEFGDLEAYLHGFGHLLDLIRGTTEQAYADAFSEEADNGRDIQTWLIPYLADLVGAELSAPAPDARREELNNSVAWYKSKGSLKAIDHISDVVAGSESVVIEGWRHTLTTPRMTLPPFTAPAAAMGSGDPTEAPDIPQGTPDVRRHNRAVRDPQGTNPLYALRRPRRDAFGREMAPEVSFWTPMNRRGAPCFPGAFDDTSMRTPDVRAPGAARLGPHPNRTLVHVRPPEGFFARGLNGTIPQPTVANLDIDPDETGTQTFGPREVFRALGLLDESAVNDLIEDGAIQLPDRLSVTGNLTIPAGTDVHFRGLLFTGTMRLDDPATRVTLNRCTVERLVIEHSTDEPAVRATDCLLNSIRGGVGFAELVYCTVLGATEVDRLWASDCIFNGPLVDLSCSGNETCIRYSRVPDLNALEGCGADKSPSNTDADPNFIQLWFDDGGDCVLRPALFGEPGAGVLDLTSSEAVLAGAEDEGEMGACHHLYHAAQIRALRLKLTDYLPLGQEIAIRYDPNLVRLPVEAS